MSSSAPSMKQKVISLMALCSVSTAVGLFSKLSQVGGKYEFHPCSAVVCTEVYKMVISLIILLISLSCGRSSSPSQTARDVKGGGDVDGNDDVEVPPHIAPSGGTRPSSVFTCVGSLAYALHRSFADNISKMLVVHLSGLAIMYTLINVISYAIFVHASSSMFYLLKACSPVVTAALLYMMVGRTLTRPQWVAVTLQCVGLLATQLDTCPDTSQDKGKGSAGVTAVSLTGYTLILINVVAGCFSGVWNEHVIKTYGNSVNVQNIILYMLGSIINMLLFLFAPPHWLGADMHSKASVSQLNNVSSHTGDLSTITATTTASMGFFNGYSWTVVGIIIANGSVGLVITAVYKYADVIVKTSGIAGATVTLFALEMMGVIPGKHMPLGSTTTGAAVVFYASYAYILPYTAFFVTCRNDKPSQPQMTSDDLKIDVKGPIEGDSNDKSRSPYASVPTAILTWPEVWRSYNIRVLLSLVGLVGIVFMYDVQTCWMRQFMSPVMVPPPNLGKI